MTIDVNATVRYTTGGVTYRALVQQVKNGGSDIADLMVYPTIGLVQNVSCSADGRALTNGTWAIGAGVY